MSMIVARMQKMKAENLIGIGNHNQRKTKNHSNPDIDTSLSELNYDLVNRTENYKDCPAYGRVFFRLCPIDILCWNCNQGSRL